MEELITAIEAYETKLSGYANAHNGNSSMYKFVFGHNIGKTYIKIWIGEVWFNHSEDILHKSVFCFVDKEGNIYKPASWQVPAKGIRGNIFDTQLPMTSRELYSKQYR